jgi:hypothetical protein
MSLSHIHFHFTMLDTLDYSGKSYSPHLNLNDVELGRIDVRHGQIGIVKSGSDVLHVVDLTEPPRGLTVASFDLAANLPGRTPAQRRRGDRIVGRVDLPRNIRLTFVTDGRSVHVYEAVLAPYGRALPMNSFPL